MLVRITWALVVAALGTLIGGFFTPDSNVLLFVAIGLALCVIVLVLASWLRRAREASAYGFGGEREAATDAPEDADEELFAALERDEEFAIGERRSRRTRRRPTRPSTKRASTSRGKPKAKPKAARKSGAKRGAAKPKATSRAKPKAVGGTTTRAKAKPKPTRRRPESA